ncbi:pyridine nucleotide-disulfide oxidoreductase [Burkholderia sp. Bp9126]|nr:pyridine nucleotide-disulfide oxidoreductase [Burkholderia sp. Bp9126]
MANERVMAIVGAGHVGGRAAQTLRDAGWGGRIALIGAEPHLPYERPPLSKGVLTGERTAAHCRLRVPDARVVLVGGGFVGLEVAASACRRGCRVTVLEAAPRVLGRAVPEPLAARVQALHVRHGVQMRVNRAPVAIARTAGGALAVTLDDGETLAADTVVVGIGIEPADELARDAGLAVARGIVVNARLETSAPDIYAVGDVAVFPSALSGRPLRQETWHGAETQARVAARNMLGAAEPYRDLPWFWSDRYDGQPQVAGEPALGVHEVVRRGADDDAIHFHFDAGGRLVAASGFGRAAGFAKEMKLARMLVERGAPVVPAALADAGVKLKTLLSAPGG